MDSVLGSVLGQLNSILPHFLSGYLLPVWLWAVAIFSCLFWMLYNAILLLGHLVGVNAPGNQELLALREARQMNERQLELLQDDVNNLRNDARRLRDDAAALQRQKRELQEEKDILIEDLKCTQDTIKQLRENRADRVRADSLQKKLNAVRESNKELTEESARLQVERGQLQREKWRLERDSTTLRKKKDNLEKVVEQLQELLKSTTKAGELSGPQRDNQGGRNDVSFPNAAVVYVRGERGLNLSGLSSMNSGSSHAGGDGATGGGHVISAAVSDVTSGSSSLVCGVQERRRDSQLGMSRDSESSAATSGASAASYPSAPAPIAVAGSGTASVH